MRIVVFVTVFANSVIGITCSAEPDTLPRTKPLTAEGDIAAQMVAGVNKFLLRKIDESVEKRANYWKRDFSSPEAYNKSIEPNRRRLAKMLGVVDERVDFDDPEIVGTTRRAALQLKTDTISAYVVRWPVLNFPARDGRTTVAVHGEGLLLVPNGRLPLANVIAICDADQIPEAIAGVTGDVPEDAQFARQLAESGCRVIVPAIVSREYGARNGRARMTNREFVYRSSFELGRHLIGYELQKVLACVDWCEREREDNRHPSPIAVIGYGEGGSLALYAAALDPRIDAACVLGYFDDRNSIWEQTLDRNVFGLLTEFGDAELASMVAPRKLLLTNEPGPEITFPSEGGAPATLRTPSGGDAEYQRFRKLVPDDSLSSFVRHVNGREEGIDDFGELLGVKILRAPNSLKQKEFAEDVRENRQVAECDRYSQALLAESPYVRKERFWDKLDYSSVEAFEKTVAPFREEFKHEVIGHFDDRPLPFNPRTRKAYDKEKWVGYEVMLDLWPDVFCYGILCLPKDMQRDGSERRPVVVCQHGLEGRPQLLVEGDHRAYHDFASKLCQRGFITFCPQNLYIGRDRFRTLQRKANPLGKTLFSIITPQHQQIIDWLKTLNYVDGERIGFYGLSYGGKTAMRVPPLVPDYKCVICSADFNDWVWKNASTRAKYSYVWTGEYEIFEWNLGHTFNYAEMAALIAPRPFMVERGHFDGVAPDERVAYEFAKVRHLYNARLKMPEDRCQIEWFAGPHTINGQGTFAFLHQHLNWPLPKKDEQ